MPPETPQTEDPKDELSAPTAPRPEEETSPAGDRPVSFVPHSPAGTEPVRIRTGRFGELEEHELIHLLDTIADERARSRFRESVYLSLFFWLAVAWFVFYGPRVLWHAPQIKLASDVLKEREMVTLNAPVLPKAPRVKPPPPTKLDNKTLSKLREMTRTRAPRVAPPEPSPSQQPAPAAIPTTTPPPNLTVPNAPQPTRSAPSVLTEAPSPQPNSRPNFATHTNPSDMMNDIAHAARSGSSGSGITFAPARGGSSAGAGSEILSDTQGVDFTLWKRRFDRGTIDAWMPLLPEEIQPPLSKKGTTTLLLTVLPDGSIGDLKLEGSTHDDAINKAAWGSIISQGKLPALPKEFHGPNLVLRLHYLVNMDR